MRKKEGRRDPFSAFYITFMGYGLIPASLVLISSYVVSNLIFHVDGDDAGLLHIIGIFMFIFLYVGTAVATKKTMDDLGREEKYERELAEEERRQCKEIRAIQRKRILVSGIVLCLLYTCVLGCITWSQNNETNEGVVAVFIGYTWHEDGTLECEFGQPTLYNRTYVASWVSDDDFDRLIGERVVAKAWTEENGESTLKTMTKADW